ncbi:biotin-dependent carboxyltransferase family protein [Oceanimonas sp. MB9]|uniref:5-oxoprolinase subunit C family protein n=1 Tax=Oceanimonas sp. MB9 TaxID=2588453 RepID=UPI0013F68978|nr:biotin-dependent carboxyltransferase family protein [Oceanimonas sp. MB9]NHH99316.1 KipI antagonist [Oceanimonas sp. MB9]
MSAGFITINRPGPLTTVQDAGRFGVRRLGITQGGPADLHAWAWANWLVGNPWGSAAVEITLGGLELTAEHDCLLALTGADMQASRNGEPQPGWQSFTLKAGQRLSLDMCRQGVRGYLAVAGGFVAEPVLGSAACVVRDGLGGHRGDGSKLAEGDRLAFAGGGQARPLPANALPDYAEPVVLGLIPGAQIAEFDGASLFEAFNRPWQVDTRADRMGVRLLGPTLKCKLTSMVSEGISLGAVQVPPDGQPIALLNDRQTIGGYPRLGTLSPLACARLAQCPPGSELRLRAISQEQALRDYRRFRTRFN